MKNGGAAPVLLPNITLFIILLYNILVIKLTIPNDVSRCDLVTCC